jgi:hypothetical protein
VAVLGLLTAGVASAQVERPERPEHGLFGSPPSSPDARQFLDASISVFGAYDDNVLADQGLPIAADQLRGGYSGVDAGLSYQQSGRLIEFGASGGVNTRDYPGLQTGLGLGLQGASGIQLRGRKTRLRLSASANRSPYLTFSLLPSLESAVVGDLPPQTGNTFVNERDWHSYGSDVVLERTLGRRGSADFSYTVRRMAFPGPLSDQRRQSVGGTYRYRFNRDAAFRAGYTYDQVDLASPIRTTIHNLDIGVDYNRPLSRSRKTYLALNMGSAVVNEYGRQLYRFVGDAAINHQIGRTWNTRVSYHRGVGILGGFNAPFFSDVAALNVSGWITRRLDLHLAADYTTGDFGLVGSTNGFNTYSGTGRLRYAFSHSVAVYGEYARYRYQFSTAAGLPPGFGNALDRQSIRAGVMTWLPLMTGGGW